MSSSSEEEDLQMQEDSSGEEVHSDDAGVADGDTEDDGESEAGESEAEDSDGDPPTADAPALDASSTESDDDDDDNEVGDDEDVPKAAESKKPVTKIEKVTNELMEGYRKRQGRQLYIRFPERLPEEVAEFKTKVKLLSDLIVEAHKPRQKHARFCLVDFASSEDRDKTLKKLNKTSAETKIVASLPRTENEDFIKSLAEKKLKRIENKRAKQLLRKESKRTGREFTSTIVVLNIPKSASTAQVKELFPDAVDIQMKPAPSKFDGASIATITLPSTIEARKNVKRILNLGGTKLKIRFNQAKKKKSNKKPQKNVGEAASVKGPIAPNSAIGKGNKQKKKKENKANGSKAAEEQVTSQDGEDNLESKKKTNASVKPSPLVSNGNSQKMNKKNKNKTNGTKATKEDDIPKEAKLSLNKRRESEDGLENGVPQKKAKVVVSVEEVTKAPQKKAGDSKFPQKKGKQVGNAKGNTKVPQKKENASPNKKQNKQKKPQKKGKVVAV